MGQRQVGLSASSKSNSQCLPSLESADVSSAAFTERTRLPLGGRCQGSRDSVDWPEALPRLLPHHCQSAPEHSSSKPRPAPPWGIPGRSSTSEMGIPGAYSHQALLSKLGSDHLPESLPRSLPKPPVFAMAVESPWLKA